MWNSRDYTLGFRVDNIKEEEYTRVSLTSKVATVFDPLGLAAPLIVKAKVRLRELGVKGLRWSDPADETDRVWWESWFAIMRELIHVSIERCLFPEETEIIHSQLHVFGDASEEAYAAVVYLRNTYNSGQVTIRLVKASSKLAPKKVFSVPKLELNAALLSSRAAAAIQSCITFDSLGLAASLIVKAKVRLRELGVKGLRWSDPADGMDRVWWESWFAIMRELIHVSIKRCLFPEETEIIHSQQQFGRTLRKLKEVRFYSHSFITVGKRKRNEEGQPFFCQTQLRFAKSL